MPSSSEQHESRPTRGSGESPGSPGAGAGPTIKVEHLSFTYRGARPTDDARPTASGEGARTRAPEGLHGIDLECPPGSLTVLCGASGSGKSTLLRTLNGLVPHFHEGTLTGTVEVAGRRVPQLPQSLVGLDSATVFQNPATQFFTAEVSSELAFRGENYGLPPERIIADCLRVVRRLGLEELLPRAMSDLSGGEMQRIACAQAVIAGTDVLLFDEPTSNLSPAAIDEFADLLADLKDDGRTIVVAEHRLYYLRDLADTVVVLSHGEVQRQWHGADFFAQSDEQRVSAGLRTLTRPLMPMASVVPPPVQVPDVDPSGSSGGLRLEDLRFAYGEHEVLRVPWAEFPAGEIHVLVGDNGAGKSTLARVICGLNKAGRGRISLGGRVCGPRALTKAAYIVMQDTGKQLFAETALGEVMLGLASTRTGEDLAREYLDKLDLGDFADRHPLSLSGGQKQRLVIAAALACDKEVFVFDEPSSGVDHRHLMAICDLLRELAAAGNVVIVITHDQELAARCADHVWRLHTLGTGCVDAQLEKTWSRQERGDRHEH